MYRGIILTTPVELQHLHAFAYMDLVEKPELLKKITPDGVKLQEVAIELSRDDVETLLDILAAPRPEEPPELQSMRKKLQAFLLAAR